MTTSTAAGSSASTSGVDILLVEDSPEDAELTMRALRDLRIANEVRHVVDGAAALEYLLGAGAGSNGGSARLVLLDIKLPLVDGIEVLQRIRADERTRTLPVVMLTSSRQEQDLVRSYELGVNSFITKPVEARQFQAAVQQIGMYWMLLNEPPR